MKVETVDDYLARGGKITVIESVSCNRCLDKGYIEFGDTESSRERFACNCKLGIYDGQYRRRYREGFTE